MTSGMIAQAPLAYFVDEFGWRSSLFLLGCLGFGLAVLVFGLVRNAPTGQPQISGAGFDKVAFFCLCGVLHIIVRFGKFPLLR